MEAIQQSLAVLLVLALLGGTLLWLRRRGAVHFGGFGSRRDRQMQSLERLPLTPQHSLHLVSVGGKVLLIAASPNGCSVLESSVTR